MVVLRRGGVIFYLVSSVQFMEIHPIKEGAETPIHCATLHHEALNNSLSIEGGGDTGLDVLRIQLDCSMQRRSPIEMHQSPFACRLATFELGKGQEFHNFV